MTAVVADLLIPKGEGPSRWSDAELQDLIDSYLGQPPALLATGGEGGCAIELAYGSRTSLCQLVTDQPHPRYGSGLLLIQSFPITPLSDAEGTRLALSLNTSELTTQPLGYGLGSYVYEGGCIHFNGFLPNLSYHPGVLPNLYFAAAVRAAALAERMADRIPAEKPPAKAGGKKAKRR